MAGTSLRSQMRLGSSRTNLRSRSGDIEGKNPSYSGSPQAAGSKARACDEAGSTSAASLLQLPVGERCKRFIPTLTAAIRGKVAV